MAFEPTLFGAFGDADDGGRAAAPWQIGQFETSDKEADEWLTRTNLGGSGGSWGYESADLALYFLGYHTSIDCWEKRKKRGYAFITTDDLCRPVVRAATVNRLLGREELDADLPIETVLAKAAEMWDIHILIPDNGRAKLVAPYPDDRNWKPHLTVEEHWRKRVGTHATIVVLKNPYDSAAVPSIIFGIGEGVHCSLDAVRETLRTNFNRGPVEVERVIRAITPHAKKMGLSDWKKTSLGTR